MNQAGTIVSPQELPESQKAALLKLLADDDPAIYRDIRQRILSFGTSAADWLRPHLLSRDPTLRRRAQEIVGRLEGQMADDRFLCFCVQQGEELDLERGAWLLAQTQYPDINIEAYGALLDSFAEDVRGRLEPRVTSQQALKALNPYLFEELGFAGNEENYYDPENSYLNRVVD
ncbi:MAG: transglutaminase family protein, partial [Limisphaerales bacterium]